MAKTNTSGAKASETSKAGASAPATRTRAQGYVIAPGHSFHGREGRLEAGTPVTAEMLKTPKDPTGKTEFDRQVKNGSLVPSNKTADDVDGKRAGGGVIEQGGATGAGPSGAQITAAEGGDEGSQAVVAAAIGGTQEELEKAAGDVKE